MRHEFAFALFAILPAALAAGQQAAPPTSSAPATAPPAPETVYYAGPGVTAPELLPVTVTDLATGHCKKLDGNLTLVAVVGADGIPRNVFLLSPIDNDLANMALKLVNADRFKPGTHDGVPVAVAVSVHASLHACVEEKVNEAGQKVYDLRLRSLPTQKLDLKMPLPPAAMDALTGTLPPPPKDVPPEVFHPGPGTTAPVLRNRVEAKYSDYGLQQRINGVCVISLIVDVHGTPQNVHVIRSLEPSLDQNAINAVSQYRFKPAMRNGTPVPVMITVEVDFHLYPK